MTETPVISKAPFPHASMDFDALRKMGIAHLEKMGTRLWTDFNLHDPGITILEVLCYAITDLGYRTNFPIEDILAAAGGSPDKKQFFSAGEILTCNPVTENDFRKILIDLGGINNAWLVKTERQEMWLATNEKGGLTATQPGNTPPEIRLNGLYDVYLDLDDSVDHDDADRVDDIVQSAWRQLWKHRNLCEDFVAIRVAGEMEFGIDLQVELCPDADVNNVAGDICYAIQEFLTPTIRFYDFNEMYNDRKRSCGEIYEGPVLCNGFIDDDELDKARLRNAIYKSDLWQVIMDVCGVAAINKLNIRRCDGTEGDRWCLPVDKYHKPVLNLKCSALAFQKEFDCIMADEKKVLERISLLKKLNKPVKKSQDGLPIPAGTNRNLEEYFSIQNEFPGTYKIGEGQIIGTDSELRQAQARQLKGYLLLFDQLLAGYLSQLAKVRDLLTVSQAEDPTYFYQALYDIPGISDLVRAANRFTVTAETRHYWNKLNIPEETIAALTEFKEGTVFRSEKDFIYQLSLILCEEQIEPHKPAVLSQLKKNGKGQWEIRRNSDYQRLPENIRNAVEGLSAGTFRDEEKVLHELYISVCSIRIKKYRRQLVEQLVVSPADGSSWEDFTGDKGNGYLSALAKSVETDTKNRQRRNIFLDHLLARFGESFSEYVVKSYQEQCSCSVSAEGVFIENKLLQDKAAFLQELPVLGSERGKGFNYKALDCGKPDVWDTANVEGLKKRVCKYLGYDYTRKTLTCPPEFDIVPYRVIAGGKVQKHRLRLQDKAGKVLLDGVKDYRQQANALKDAKDLREQVLRSRIFLSAPDAVGSVRVYVLDREDNIALQGEMLKPAEADELKGTIEMLAFPECCAIRGFHIVEHILLRPKDDDYLPLFDPVIVPDLSAGQTGDKADNGVIADPYSFWITVVAPAWLPEFKNNSNAQNRFEHLVRRECPAHIAVKFCWLSAREMYWFESFYLQWLYENGLEKPNERELTGHVNDLVTFLKQYLFSIRDKRDPCFQKPEKEKYS
ncbi:MAG: hypothetical protein ABW019_05460 [Chitinophagaceae bacterium]